MKKSSVVNNSKMSYSPFNDDVTRIEKNHTKKRLLFQKVIRIRMIRKKIKIYLQKLKI